MDYSRISKVAAPALFLAAAAGLSLLFKKKPTLEEVHRWENDGKTIVLLRGEPTLSTAQVLIIPNSPGLTFESTLPHSVLKSAGPSLQAECRDWVNRFNRLIPGECAATGAGDLQVKHIVHVVPPPSPDPAKLAQALQNALEVACNLGASVISVCEVGWRREYDEEEYARVVVRECCVAAERLEVAEVQVVVRTAALLPALTRALTSLNNRI